MIFAPTPILADTLPVSFALSFMARYSEKNLQQIFRTVLDFSPLSALAPAFVISQQYKNPCKRPLKARFLDMYYGKTYLKYYNFFQQCRNYFAIASTKSQNKISFAVIFINNIALFCWKKYQRKVKDETDVSITWKEFKAFFCQSLGKSEAFVDTI